MIAVTSFAPKHFETYGREMLETFSQYWPGEILCYVDEIPEQEYPMVTYKLLRKVHGHDAFLTYCSAMSQSAAKKMGSEYGPKNDVTRGMIEGNYAYTYDAVRFCHKAFAQFDALKKNDGKVFWIDADSVALKPIPEEFLESIFNGATLSILSRPGFYTETGFVGFDTRGDRFKEFVGAYERVYSKGVLFTLPGWHDCYALDRAINDSEVPYNDLVGGWKLGDKLEVMENTVLGEYIYHKKGNQKWKKN